MYLLGTSTEPSLGNIQWRGQEILKHHSNTTRITLDHVTLNQKVSSLARGIHYTKFGNFQAKGSKDIERTTFFKEQ